ncbi:MAG: type I-Fv CRISPR-associated protein Cas5fv [Flavobacteriaceae bacterium]
MKLIIEYESSWRNVFCDGSNNEPTDKNGRRFIASSQSINHSKESTYKETEVTKNTVLGILNRLIGERRKLFQIKQSDSNYFADIENCIHFKDSPTSIDNEIVYLRNSNNSTDKKSFSGVINADVPAFNSKQGKLLWGVLKLTFDEAVSYLTDKSDMTELETSPLQVIEQFELVASAKPIKYDKVAPEDKDKYIKVSNLVGKILPNSKNLNANGFSFKFFYADMLRIRMKYLEESGYDFSEIKTKKGNISGVNPSGITFKDFIKPYVSGSSKLVYGNPYLVTKPVFAPLTAQEIAEKEALGLEPKGEFLMGKALKKASGTLTIEIDVSKQRAREIKTLIENAGVLTFKVGKKSVAYIKNKSLE